MSIIIIAVAVFMNQQGDNDLAGADAVDTPAAIEGFRADAWMLPDDPLLGFVQIPAGAFTMGSNPGLDRMAYANERWSNLRRQGSPELGDYYLARFETTVGQFKAYLAATSRSSDAPGLQAPDDFPIAGITWPEAVQYAQWLEQALRESGQTPAPIRDYLAQGGRVSLPSEAEWEKAARGGDGRIWPWGSQPRAGLANFNSDAPQPVGAQDCPDCAHGLEDMAGNVWEMTRSPLQDYPYDPADDWQNLADDALYVMRGGSFSDGPENVRAAVRGGVDPSVRNAGIGFRLAITREP